MSNHLPKPVALTIAGSDSGGGAGIQADLRTFIELGVHGTTAITAITAQNPAGVRAVLGTRPEIVHSQIEAVAAFYQIGAAKTGMLYDIPIIEVVIEFFAAAGRPAVRIVDPVMVATSGSKLLLDPAIEQLRSGLLPLATLVTPNLDEAELLLNRPVRTADAMASAARELFERFGCAALVKGGHLTGATEARDIFFDGDCVVELKSEYFSGLATHGTGCTFSAAIAAFCARGLPLSNAVREAKNYMSQRLRAAAIEQGLREHANVSRSAEPSVG